MREESALPSPTGLHRDPGRLLLPLSLSFPTVPKAQAGPWVPHSRRAGKRGKEGGREAAPPRVRLACWCWRLRQLSTQAGSLPTGLALPPVQPSWPETQGQSLLCSPHLASFLRGPRGRSRELAQAGRRLPLPASVSPSVKWGVSPGPGGYLATGRDSSREEAGPGSGDSVASLALGGSLVAEAQVLRRGFAHVSPWRVRGALSLRLWATQGQPLTLSQQSGQPGCSAHC